MTSDELSDTGAPAERTALAWQRTGLSAMAVGVLLVHTHPAAGPLTPWPGFVMMAAGGLLGAVVAPLRYLRILRAVRGGATPLARRVVPGMVLVILVVVAGTALSLVVG